MCISVLPSLPTLFTPVMYPFVHYFFKDTTALYKPHPCLFVHSSRCYGPMCDYIIFPCHAGVMNIYKIWWDWVSYALCVVTLYTIFPCLSVQQV